LKLFSFGFFSENRISSKRIIEKLLDQIDLNLTLTFEHILKQLLGESNSTITENFLSFMDILLDYYLKLTTDHSKKNLSDEFFKQIQQRQIAFLQLISFVISYDKKHRLASHFNSIIQSLLRRIEKDDLNYLRYQIQILSNLLTAKSSLEVPNDFYHLISKKLLQSSIELDQNSWINCMKQFCILLFLKEPTANDFLMKFLRSLAEQINWPLENVDYQTKLNDNSWRKTFIRLLTSINTLLTHRVKKYEFINISSIKKFQKEKPQLILNDEENEFDNENSVSSTISRQLFEDDDDDDENINNDDDMQQDLNLLQQQHSDLDHLEQELLQTNSLFYSIEKWFEIVRKSRTSRFDSEYFVLVYS
jgi:hypothetical protein